MGTFNKGILGGFSGKVGNVIVSNWKGKDVVRSLLEKSTDYLSLPYISYCTPFLRGNSGGFFGQLKKKS